MFFTKADRPKWSNYVGVCYHKHNGSWEEEIFRFVWASHHTFLQIKKNSLFLIAIQIRNPKNIKKIESGPAYLDVPLWCVRLFLHKHFLYTRKRGIVYFLDPLWKTIFNGWLKVNFENCVGIVSDRFVLCTYIVWGFRLNVLRRFDLCYVKKKKQTKTLVSER